MPVALRLSRAGAKKRPYYRLIATDSRNARDGGNFLERLGAFNPLLGKDDPKRFTFNEERVKYWISVGGQASEKVEKLLANAGMIKLKTDYSKKPKKAVKNPGKLGGGEAAAAPAEAAAAAPAEKPAEAAAAAPAEKPAEAAAAPAEAQADQAPSA